MNEGDEIEAKQPSTYDILLAVQELQSEFISFREAVANAVDQIFIDLTDISATVETILVSISPLQATKQILTIQSQEKEDMSLTIDSVGAAAVLAFEDRLGDPVAPPAGVLSTATSSDTTVMTVGPATPGTDANNNPVIKFPLTEVKAGTVSLSVKSTDANGNPLLAPDGTTPITDPAPVSVTVNPGAAAEEIFTVPGA